MEIPTFSLIFILPSLVITFIPIWLTICYFKNSQKPKIYTGNPKLNRFLQSHVPILLQEYKHSWLWGWNGQLHTIIHEIMRLPRSHKLPWTREIFKLPDDGQLGLDYFNLPASTQFEKNQNPSKLVVLILPGLLSTSNSAYIKSVALAISKKNAIVITANCRGLARVPLTTPHTFSATYAEDIHHVIEHLRKKFPECRLMAIGASLGAMQLCQYLIKHPVEAKESLSAAVLLSIVWDCQLGAISIEESIVNRYVINRTLARGLAHVVKQHRQVLEKRECNWNLDKAIKARTVREFDAHFICPQFGYASPSDYYNDITIRGRIHKFPVPVFALSARDDPMQPGYAIPIKEAEKSQNLALIVTEYGGHLGFLQSSLPKPVHFMEKFVGELVAGIIQHDDQL